MTKPNPKSSQFKKSLRGTPSVREGARSNLVLIIFLLLIILVLSPQNVWAWVSVSLNKTILPADGKSTTKVSVYAWDENGKPFSSSISFSLNPTVGSFTKNPITTGRDGRGSTTYKAGTIPGYIFITAASSKGSGSARIALVGVEITGFSVNPTWALGNGCNVENHKSTCQATINPPDVSTIIYSIRGNAHGATINDTTGVITPSTNNSGEITIRAAAKDLLTCYDEKSLLIRAHPTQVANSTVTPSGPYGGRWTHTFRGTGGTLEGVQISETVKTEQPNPFGYYFNVAPGPPNVWDLNANGTMTDPDYYVTGTQYFDARNFLPSPPKIGLPQTGTDRQWYHWWCPLDGNWIQFVGPTNINVTLMLQGKNLVVRTAAYGKRVDDIYIGPAVLDGLLMQPQVIIADGKSKSKGVVGVIPKARTVKWSIEGDTLGAKIDTSTGFVTAGYQDGRITVRVTDSNYSDNFLETQLSIIK